mmetsp:Transcript_23739/g.66294  ORF Transcript_23739/g.66294 Transcript_23739/m.66294 type:complete len:85 (-) Transcript_23739:245-499(-)
MLPCSSISSYHVQPETLLQSFRGVHRTQESREEHNVFVESNFIYLTSSSKTTGQWSLPSCSGNMKLSRTMTPPSSSSMSEEQMK